MSARLIFLIITTLIIFLIVFANSYLIVRLTNVKRRSRWFWRLVLLQVLAIGGTTYYQMAQVQLWEPLCMSSGEAGRPVPMGS